MKSRVLLVFFFQLWLSFALAQDSTFFEAGKVYVFRNLGYAAGNASIDLENSDLQQLTQLGIAMKKMPGMKIRIEGHTDPKGDRRLNLDLSQERAESVKNYLVGLGISKSRIQTMGYGGTQPIDTNNPALNRRVVVRILENPNPILITSKPKSLAIDSSAVISKESVKPKPQLHKVALVIGNSNYSDLGKLKNPVNDVDLVAKTLRDLKFIVFDYKNLAREKMIEAIRLFTKEVAKADVVFVYFAGHGMQHQGVNYLLPIDVKLTNGPMDLQFETVKVDVIFNSLEFTNNESLNIIVLDACRNNPFSNWSRSGGTGLAEIKPPSGSLIAFATSPGALAFDGEGSNGVYTEALVDELKKPQRLEDVFMNTRIKVEKRTNGSQSPWELFRLRAAYQLAE